VKWDYAIAFMVTAYLFTVFFSIVTIILEEHTYHQYTKRELGYSCSKPLFRTFINHPFILYAAIKGNIDYHFNKKEMGRNDSQHVKVKNRNNSSKKI
jgi:predicted membrane protein